MSRFLGSTFGARFPKSREEEHVSSYQSTQWSHWILCQSLISEIIWMAYFYSVTVSKGCHIDVCRERWLSKWLPLPLFLSFPLTPRNLFEVNARSFDTTTSYYFIIIGSPNNYSKQTLTISWWDFMNFESFPPSQLTNVFLCISPLASILLPPITQQTPT